MLPGAFKICDRREEVALSFFQGDSSPPGTFGLRSPSIDFSVSCGSELNSVSPFSDCPSSLNRNTQPFVAKIQSDRINRVEVVIFFLHFASHVLDVSCLFSFTAFQNDG